jgi:hypothetical protein
MPVGVLGTAAVGAAVGAGVSGAIGGLSQAAQSTALFDKEDKERLARLEALRASGQLGLKDNERTRIKSEQAAQRGGILRSLESQQVQGMQQLANRQALSGRELFLAQMVGQQAEVDLVAKQAEQLNKENLERIQAQREEIAELKSARGKRRAGVRGGLTQFFTAGALGAGVPAIDQAITKNRAMAAEEQQRLETDNIAMSGRAAETTAERDQFWQLYGNPGLPTR